MKPASLAFALLLTACGEDNGNMGTNVGNGATINASLTVASADLLAATSKPDGTIVIVGLEGALSPAGGALTATEPPWASVGLIGSSGSFVVLLPPLWGESVTIRYSVDGLEDGVLTVPIAGDLNTRPEPTPMTSAGPLLTGPVMGNVTVNLGILMGPAAPYVIANKVNAEVRRADTAVATDIPAQSGDRICVFSIAGGLSDASASVCEDTP